MVNIKGKFRTIFFIMAGALIACQTVANPADATDLAVSEKDISDSDANQGTNVEGDQDQDGILVEYDCDDTNAEKGECEAGDACISDEQCGNLICAEGTCQCSDPKFTGPQCQLCSNPRFTGENCEETVYKGGWPVNPDKDLEESPPWTSTPAAGVKIPRYRAYDQYGELVDIYDLMHHGKPIVIDVATWFCEPCKGIALWFATGDDSHMEEWAWYKESYFPIWNMIQNQEIIWITVLYSMGSAVTYEDAEAWHDEWPNANVLVLADSDLQLKNYLQVKAMPHIAILDEKLEFILYDVNGPTPGFKKLMEMETGEEKE